MLNVFTRLRNQDRRTRAEVPAHGRRLDIQGLRALAVLAVIAHHLTGFPGGGFVGVDIFFVISGFVITLGMLREHENTGALSFKDFYFRRVARILPAGILVILATVAFSFAAFFAERANAILLDGLWALLFSANWRFALTGTDYWAEDSPVSPLQHYWSLGVEEQFYFAWPLIFITVLGVAVKARVGAGHRRMVLAVTVCAIIATSFLWSLAETRNDAPWAYFSTVSRAWELGVGALLAVMNPTFSKLGSSTRIALAWAGMTGIAVSIAIVAKTFAFPAPWAALPVLSAALVIAAGAGGPVLGFRFLTNRVSTYIGNASYSLYLWHFPIIILFGALWPPDDVMYYPLMIVLIGFFAVVSYEAVEIPVQGWLTARYKSKSWRLSSRVDGWKMPVRARRFGMAALLVAVMITVPLAVRQTAPIGGSGVPVAIIGTGATDETDHSKQAQLATHIEEALAAPSWPELTPSFDNILADSRPEEDGEGCGDTDLLLPNCVFSSGQDETVVVLGDSTAITLLPTIRAALQDQYDIRGMTKAGCTILDLEVPDDQSGFVEDCAAFKAEAIAQINEMRPTTVFLSNTSAVLDRLGPSEEAAGQAWEDGTAGIIEALAPSSAEIVVVTAPPSGNAPSDCATRASSPRDCTYEIPANFLITAAAMKEAADATGAKFIDTRGWFCSSAGHCPSFVGNTPVKRDKVHTTKQYAAELVPVFEEALADE